MPKIVIQFDTYNESKGRLYYSFNVGDKKIKFSVTEKVARISVVLHAIIVKQFYFEYIVYHGLPSEVELCISKDLDTKWEKMLKGIEKRLTEVIHAITEFDENTVTTCTNESNTTLEDYRHIFTLNFNYSEKKPL